MIYGYDHTITTWVVSCWCGWQQYQHYVSSTPPATAISHVCKRTPAEEPTR